MSSFKNGIAVETKKVLETPEMLNRNRTGRTFWAISSSDANYSRFRAEHPAYEDMVDAVYTTIQAALDAASDNDLVFVVPKDMAAGATDPESWAENLTIDAGQSGLVLCGLSNNRTQGGLPQIKKGSGSTALLTVRAPGCEIRNLGFNGSGSTGGGILLDDDASTKSAFGTIIEDCHFKNCKGSTATDASTGGAIQWAATGGAWQVLVKGCRFYKNVGDVVLLGTSSSVPQDVVIEDCVFSGLAAQVDCNLYLAGGSGMAEVVVRRCVFPAVDIPQLSSGANLRYIDMTGCTGSLTECQFACTGKTFGAAGDAALIPTTVRMGRCYQENAIITRT